MTGCTDIHISQRIRALPRVGSRKLSERIAAARAQGVDVLTLEPYLNRAPAPHILAAATAEMQRNQETDSRGLTSLRQAIALQVGHELGRTIDGEQEILITNGAMQALNVTFRTLLDAGDEVLIPTPCYYFQGCVELASGSSVYVPMAEVDGYAWDVEALAAAITPRTRAIIVNTPVNPTGRVLTQIELAQIAELARRHELVIVADESYDRMVYDDHRHLSIAALPDMAERTVLIKSLTKSYAMPAWRVGYLVAPSHFVTWATKALEWELLHCNHVAHAAAAAAIAGPQDDLLSMAAEFQSARDRLIAGLAAIDSFSCVVPQGGPFIFLNCSKLFSSSEAASDALLAVGVPAVPGWYCRSDSHVRIAMGAPYHVLDDVIRRLAQVAEMYQRDPSQ